MERPGEVVGSLLRETGSEQQEATLGRGTDVGSRMQKMQQPRKTCIVLQETKGSYRPGSCKHAVLSVTVNTKI